MATGDLPLPPAPAHRAVRGLVLLFWMLPATLLISVKTVAGDWFRAWGPLPVLLAHTLLWHALRQLRPLADRPSILPLFDRAQIVAFVNIGLAPFLFFLHARPGVPFFEYAVVFWMVVSVIFLIYLNQLLALVTEQFSDEILRLETRFFARANLYLLLALLFLSGLYTGFAQTVRLPLTLLIFREWLLATQTIVLLILVVVPISLTMSLLWKLKEVILFHLLDPGS